MATAFGSLARKLHFEETSLIWDYSEALRLESSWGGEVPHPSGRILLLNARKCSGEEEPTWQGGRGGLITPRRGTGRGTDPQEPGIGRW